MGEYKTSLSLQTQVPSVSSVTLGLEGTSDPSEARYWTTKYNLGSTYASYTPNRFAHAHSLYFKANSNAIVSKVLFGPPTFQNSKQSPLAVVSGPRVSLYTGPAFSRALKENNNTIVTTLTPDRNVVTGGHPALCAAHRSDGRLIAIGTSLGNLLICDATSRATLCTFFAGEFAIRTVSWLRNGKQVISGGSDGVLRKWDLNSSTLEKTKACLEWKGHSDAIKCALVWQPRNTNVDWKELAISGSSDYTIRIWNMQQDENSCLSILQHGAPVEALLLQPHASPDTKNPPWLLSAGGTTIKVWNPLSGKCVCTLGTQHSKTITSMVAMARFQDGESGTSNSTAMRILTAGLDGLVRIHSWNHETGQVEHLHGVKLVQGAITTMAVNETYNRLVFGTNTGIVIVKERSKSITKQRRKREARAGTYAYFTRGMNVSAADGGTDFVAQQQDKKRKLSSFDLALRQFRYGDALDDALNTRQPQAVVAVLEELGKRRGLTIALSNRDEETLEPVLSFTVRYITRPQYSSLLIGVAHKLCDIYGNVAGQSETIDELFDKLRNQIHKECCVQKSLLRIVGQLDAICTMAEMAEDEE
jgi:U3 small nucleolar RNA-associated protein 15